MPKLKQTMFFDEDLFEGNEIGDETEDDLSVDYLSKISEAVTWSTDWTVESLINQLERGIIDLNPKFQRRDAWNDRKKSRFIESLIYGLPIPQIVLAESPHTKGKYIIVDGKQRLITIKQFCSKENKGQETFSRLTKLNNPILNNLTYEELELDQNIYFNIFINQSIRSVIIRNWPSETFLYTIFYRLNTGSLSLSPQELRRALKPGPFMDFIDDFSATNKAIQNLLNLKRPDYRMRDMDLLIRYFSFSNRIESYKGDYKTFLDSTCDFYNKDWKKNESNIVLKAEVLGELIEAVNRAFKPSHSFKRWRNEKFENRFNKSIFDIMVYYIQDDKVRKEFVSNGPAIVESFKKLSNNNTVFVKAISSNTNNLIETSNRFVIWGKELNKHLSTKVKIPSTLLKIFRAKKNNPKKK